MCYTNLRFTLRCTYRDLVNEPWCCETTVCIPVYQSVNQHRKCLHRDVASTVRIITVRKIQSSKQLLKITLYLCLASLPVDQLDGKETDDGYAKDEEGEEEEDRQSQRDSSHSTRTQLLVYRIMYYPTFDWYAFPSLSASSLVSAMSRPTPHDQVSNTLHARSFVSVFGFVLSCHHV